MRRNNSEPQYKQCGVYKMINPCYIVDGQCIKKEVEYPLMKKDGESICWVNFKGERYGEFIFTFDKKKFYSLFSDYPYNLSKEEKEIFDKENPFWKDFFKTRCKK